MSKACTIPTVLVLALVMASGCGTTARFVPGPGGPLEVEKDLPMPEGDEYLAGGLGLRVYSPDLGLDQDAEFKTRLVEGMRNAAGTDFKSTRGTDKKPVYQVSVSEGTYSNENNPSALGAVGGAVLGATAGYASTKEAWVAVAGGGAGGLLGAFMFEKKVHTWAFSASFSQQTSAEGAKEIRSGGDRTITEVSEAGDVDVFQLSSAEDVERVSKQTVFDVKSNTFSETRTFLVVVSGRGFFFTKNKAKRAAKEKIAEALPGFLFGGTAIEW